MPTSKLYSTGNPLGTTISRPSRPAAMTAMERDLQYLPTRDLVAEIEHWRWLAMLDDLDYPEESRAYIEYQIEAMVGELERRQRLLRARLDDPLRPRWPNRDGNLKHRVEAVKAAWPLDHFCRQVLGMTLVDCGHGRFRGQCPFPDHADTEPSFMLYPDGSAWCFGCLRSADVIHLAGIAFGLHRFYDTLERLEREGGAR